MTQATETQETSTREPVLSLRLYTIVLLALIVATIATVAISFIHLSPAWHEAIGLLIGAAKASLVVLFFMHVIHSPRLIWLIIAVAMVWLLVLVSLTFTDYFSRDLIPFMPGH